MAIHAEWISSGELRKACPEFVEVLPPGETALGERAVGIVDLPDDRVAREQEVELDTRSSDRLDQGLTKEPDAVGQTVFVQVPGPEEEAREPVGLDLEEVAPDARVMDVSEHVMIVGIRVHAFELGGHHSAGTEDQDLVLARCEHLVKDTIEEPVARACAVGLPDGTGDEDREVSGDKPVLVEDEPECLLELGEVERRIEKTGRGSHPDRIGYTHTSAFRYLTNSFELNCGPPTIHLLSLLFRRYSMGPTEDFLSVYPKKATRKSYGAAVRLFLDSRYGPQRVRAAVTPAEQEVYERLAADYLKDLSDPAGDVIRYIAFQSSQSPASEPPPKTVNVRVVGVLQFLAHHNIDLSARDRRRIEQKIPRGGAVSKKGDLPHEVIRDILAHCDEHGRALFLLLAGSGISTSLISLRDFFHSFALLVFFGYPGFLSAGMVRTIFKVDRTASQMNSRDWPNRNAQFLMVPLPCFTGENLVQNTAIQRFLRRNEMMAKR